MYAGLSAFRYHNSSNVENMVDVMINELQDGPIECDIWSSIPEFDGLNYTNGGINIWAQNATTDFNALDHAISIVGYGTDNSSGTPVDYWLMRNSWGTYWADGGFVRVQRGMNWLGIELSCTVADATTEKTLVVTKSEEEKHLRPVNKHSEKLDSQPCRIPKTTFEGGAKVTTNFPDLEIEDSALPASWDWGDVDGTNYLSMSKN
jgi:hypothetical protein